MGAHEETPKRAEPTAKSTGKATDNKVFDIARPGKTMPSANARPTIITHRTMARDPMMSQALPDSEDSSGDDVSVATRPASGTKIRIEPLHETDDSTDLRAAEDSSEVDVSDSDQKKTIDDSTDTSSEEINDEASGSSESDAINNVDDDLEEMADTAGRAAAKKVKNAEDDAAEKRRKQAQELIDSKKYVLPIKTAQRQKSGRSLLVVVAVLVLTVLALVAAIDAELLDIDVELPFDLL